MQSYSSYTAMRSQLFQEKRPIHRRHHCLAVSDYRPTSAGITSRLEQKHQSQPFEPQVYSPIMTSPEASMEDSRAVSSAGTMRTPLPRQGTQLGEAPSFLRKISESRFFDALVCETVPLGPFTCAVRACSSAKAGDTVVPHMTGMGRCRPVRFCVGGL